jgi:hypothetical protein
MEARVFFILSIICILLFQRCSSVYNTYADQDLTIDFEKYRTYAWIARDSFSVNFTTFDNEFIEKDIQRLVNKELDARGMSFDRINPDLLINYSFIINDKVITMESPVYPYVPTPMNLTPNPYNYTTHMYNYPHSNFFNFHYNNPYNPYITPYLFDYNVPMGTNITPYIIGSYIQEFPVTEGTLVFDFIDAENNNLVWRGWSEGVLDNARIYREKLPAIINDIFKRNPLPILDNEDYL